MKVLFDLKSKRKQYTHFTLYTKKFFSSFFFFCSIKLELELNFYLSHSVCAHVNINIKYSCVMKCELAVYFLWSNSWKCGFDIRAKKNNLQLKL